MKSDMDKSSHIAILEHKLDWFEKKYGPQIEKRGLKNWKNLFRKPTLNEWIILIMLLMGLFIAWAYAQDTTKCRETLNNIEEICLQYCSGMQQLPQSQPEINLSKIILKVDNSSLDGT